MAAFMADFRFALRNVVRQPGSSIVVALTLALGLGLNATTLGMVDALFLRPFQFRDYDRLVVLSETVRGSSERESVAPANFLDWRTDARRFERLAAWQWWQSTLTAGNLPERVQGFHVSPGFFELLGIQPASGRFFTTDEDQPGNHRRIVLGNGLWRRRFGGNPGVVGTDIHVNGEPYMVVGIAPPRFAFPVGAEMWAPLAFTPDAARERETRTLTIVGTLRPGDSLTAAQAEMESIGRHLEQQYPQTNRGRGIAVETLSTAFREGGTGPVVAIIQAAGVLVLLVACANIAGLLLARGLDRKTELALRTALGASRMRIIRQLVTETIVLALVASVAAIALAGTALDLLRLSIPPDMARFIEGWDNIRLNRRLFFAVPALALVVSLVVGLIPAIAATRASLTDSLNRGAAAGAVKRQRGRQVLLVAQIACALALLITASLTVAGGIQLVNQPGGFDAERLLRLEISLPAERYREPAARREFARAFLQRLEPLPMVERMALASVLPAGGWSPAASVQMEDHPEPDPARRPRVGYRSVTPEFFETMRIPIERGRSFSSNDGETAQPVAVISASMAERYWPGEDAIGKRVRLDAVSDAWLSVVGVAGDVRMYNWWDGDDERAVYVPFRQAPPGGTLHAVLRARGEPLALTGAVREALRAVDPLVPMDQVRTMQQAIGDSTAGLTLMASLIGLCGVIAFALSIVGIYSVMVYAIAQRTREFGVRMALGATPRDVLRLTLKQAGLVTTAGLLIGMLVAYVLGTMMTSALYGIIPLEPMSFLWATSGLAIVSLGAAYVPARRVLRIDPVRILRAQ